MTRTLAQLHTAFAQGRDLLTEKQPGWEQRVNLSQLDLDKVNRCILGQIYGDYSNGCRALFGHAGYGPESRLEEDKNPRAFGFLGGYGELSRNGELHNLWAGHIRRAQELALNGEATSS